jgi:large subunit ribosomal protein LP0
MVNERKRGIVNKLCHCFTDYKQIAICTLDNVSTNQLHNARKILSQGENKGEMIIGKNTLIKKALTFMTTPADPSDANYEDHKHWSQDTRLKALEPLIKQNVGLIFSDESYVDLKKKIEAEKISMPARTGIFAPCDVTIPDGPTGIEVGKIDLFHKLNISCKTVRSAIEVVKGVKIITKGEKVGEGATQMCKLLNIVPFEYALEFKFVYSEGVIFDQEVLEMDLSSVVSTFSKLQTYATAVSVGAGIPNQLSIPHFIKNGFKLLASIGMESGYSFKELEDLQNNTVEAGPADAGPAETKAEAKKEEEAPAEEEESEDMDMMGLFDA